MDDQKKDEKAWHLFGLLIAVFAIWAASICLVIWYIPDLPSQGGKTDVPGAIWTVRGQFGDAFGAVNALFSGLAFAGIAYAILLQRIQIKQQDKETKETLGKLRDQNELISEQALEMQRSNRYQNLFSLIQFLQQSDVRIAREVLMGLEDVGFPWPEEKAKIIERAIAAYDVAGILLRDGSMSDARTILVQNWGYSIEKCFRIAKPLIEEIRKTRGKDYWDDFEWLAEQVTQRPKSQDHKQSEGAA